MSSEADLGLEPGVRAVEVSLSTVARIREQFPMFRQWRLGNVNQMVKSSVSRPMRK